MLAVVFEHRDNRTLEMVHERELLCSDNVEG